MILRLNVKCGTIGGAKCKVVIAKRKSKVRREKSKVRTARELRD